MITVEARQAVFINLPAEEVFAYISDLENLTDRSSAVIAARTLSPEEIQPGTRLRTTIRFLGTWSDMMFEVVEYECSHVLTLKSISGIARCTVSYLLEPEEDGGTTVSQEMVVHCMEGTADVAVPVTRNAIRRQLEYDLLTLKDMLEAKASGYEMRD